MDIDKYTFCNTKGEYRSIYFDHDNRRMIVPNLDQVLDDIDTRLIVNVLKKSTDGEIS